MTQPVPSPCEVKVNGQWLVVSLAEASIRFVASEKRCPACHGRVAIPGTFTSRAKRKLDHRRNHAGCPLLAKIYCGTPSPHPNAVE
ncbi:hypothetical protein FV232_26085 [Methylobacterium sp. WL30]|nr:MAG: hypothetical protein EON55_09565 [Alphaproteobacteria bacterium]TXM94035.1 hypothetical protein FV223_06245 [Methylobacterium sp. WL116]TXN39579.1 hypothetical protein FV225_09245 [Methylobacterium sp. WL93]TXN45541.1 hypothetical protein FV227_24875 [Methylobacterium sp. WL119]TXN62108.1 hypothetical protein FV232_26085 [Methylobacterium sp. WL30]